MPTKRSSPVEPEKTKQAKEAAPSAMPDWVDLTPEDILYDLAMYNDHGGGQEIEITREEFIALKQHLAALRGYTARQAQRPRSRA